MSADENPVHPLGEYQCQGCHVAWKILSSPSPSNDIPEVACPVCHESRQVELTDHPKPTPGGRSA